MAASAQTAAQAARVGQPGLVLPAHQHRAARPEGLKRPARIDLRDERRRRGQRDAGGDRIGGRRRNHDRRGRRDGCRGRCGRGSRRLDRPRSRRRTGMRNVASASARAARVTLPRRFRSEASWDRASRFARRKVHRSRVWTASLSEPATTSPSLLRVTAAMSASKRTVTTATSRSAEAAGDQRLLDVDQAVVEDEPVLLALLDGRVERLEDMVVDERAKTGRVALPIGFEDHPVGGLRAFQEARDVERRVGGEQRADARSGGRQDRPCRPHRRRTAGRRTGG